MRKTISRFLIGLKTFAKNSLASLMDSLQIL